MQTSALLLAASLALVGPVAQRSPSSEATLPAPVSGQPLRLAHCQVTLLYDVDVPAQEAGVLSKLNFKIGEVVQKDQPLAQLDDSDALVRRAAAELEQKMAQTEASSRVNIESAEAGAIVADAEYEESVVINDRNPGTIPRTQLRREEFTAKRAHLQTKVAEVEHEVAKITAEVRAAQLKVAENSLQRRTILAPIDGVIEQRLKDHGEWVNAGEPIYRLVHMNTVKVEAYIKSSEFSPHRVGDRPAIVEVRLPDGQVERFPGTIKYVSQIVESEGEYRIAAEIENRKFPGTRYWILRSGMFVDMTIQVSN